MILHLQVCIARMASAMAVADGRTRQVCKAEIGHVISSCHVYISPRARTDTIAQIQARLYGNFEKVQLLFLRLAPVIDLFNGYVPRTHRLEGRGLSSPLFYT